MPGSSGSEHAAEAAEFARLVAADGIAFRAISYQSLFSEVRCRSAEAEETYLEYLRGRYFSGLD